MLDNDKQWQKVLSGKNLPVLRDEDQQQADKIRQYLIWRKVCKTEAQITPEQAQKFYQHIKPLADQRQSQASKWSKWLKWFFIGLITVAVAIIAVWWLFIKQSSPIKSADPIGASESILSAIPSIETKFHTDRLSTDNLSTDLSLGKTAKIPTMLSIPAGSYTMGCRAGWDDRLGGCRDNERPAHSVKVAAFELSQFEITVGQFKHFIAATGYLTTAEKFSQGCVIKNPETSGWSLSKEHNWRKPGFAQSDVHPVVCISWLDTQYYIQWLNKVTGNTYRLPTEEEWEYAARANQITAFYWGSKANHNYANYAGVDKVDMWKFTSPVGQFPSNNFGLHDMLGNVWEWVDNCWREDYQKNIISNCNEKNAGKTRRGGGWDNRPPSIRSAYRSQGKVLDRSHIYGFRIAHDSVASDD